MLCEEQLDAITQVPDIKRFVLVDSTGGLVKITKHMNRNYKKIMNYVLLLKNLDDLNKPGVLVYETITSRHDTIRISEMFHLL